MKVKKETTVKSSSSKKVETSTKSSSSEASSSSEDDLPVIKQKQPVKKVEHLPEPVKRKEREQESDDEEDEEEEEEQEEVQMKIHKKDPTNGLGNGSISANDVQFHKKLAENQSDCNSAENAALGAFEKFKLPKNMTDKLEAKGIKFLYPIQIATLEHIRAGHDMIAQARTGTGKTMAFAIPIVEALQAKKTKNDVCRSPKVLVMEPTRELAKQVGDDFASICSTLKCCCVYGGVSYERQSRFILF